MKFRILLILLVLGLCGPGLFAQVVGEISYIRGTVTLNRGEKTFDKYDLEIGFRIENFDQVLTGSDGQVTITLTSASCPQANIVVSPKTTFYLEVSSLESKSATTIGLIQGSLQSKVDKLAGNKSYQITTDTTTMGVRGTTFVVSTSITGDILVACDEGKVDCYDEKTDKELYAEPGTVVEKTYDAEFSSIPIAVSKYQEFKEKWLAEKIAVFKTSAPAVLKQMALLYLKYLDEFNQEYQALAAQKAIIEKWLKEEAAGTVGSSMEVMKEKKAIIGHLFKIRRVLFIFERIYYRIAELRTYFNEGYGKGAVIRSDMKAEQFFAFVDKKAPELKKMLARIRIITLMFAKRNGGTMPLDEF